MNQLIQEQIQLPPTYSVTVESDQIKNALIVASKAVTAVTDPDSQSYAIAAGKNIRTHIKEVESIRGEKADTVV